MVDGLRRWAAFSVVLLTLTLGAWSAGALAPSEADTSRAACGHERQDPRLRPTIDPDAAALTAAIIPDDVGVDQRLLETLYGAFSHLPHFVDVHFMLQGPPRFVALFDGPLPDVLPPTEAPYPLLAERIDPVALQGPAAAAPGVRGATPPLVPTVCEGPRPGSSLQRSCTLAFMVAGVGGSVYMATAGHCVDRVGSDAGWGTVRFQVAGGVGADFALIELSRDSLATADASMCHWGGPTAVTGEGAFGDLVYQYGHGLGFGASHLTRPREAVLQSLGAISYSVIGPQIDGDSGSPMRLESGPALGVHTHATGAAGFGTGIGYGTRMTHGLALAEAALGQDLQMITADIF